MRYREIVENSGIDFDMQFDDDTGSFAELTARAQGRVLGSVKFFVDGDTLIADQLEVDERYRGQGIAAAMYDYAKSQGYTVEKSDDLTPDGEHFWNKNRGEQAVWEGSLGNVLPWPEVVNKVNSAMRAMGWKGQRRDDGSFMFSTRGSETDDQYYIVIIDNEGNSMFTYALGTVEDGSPDIGEQDTLPTTEASVSELMNAIRDGFGLNENFHDGRNPQDKGDSKRHGVPTKASISTLRKVAKQGGRKGQLAHWMANMKSGRAKAKRK